MKPRFGNSSSYNSIIVATSFTVILSVRYSLCK